MVEKYIAFLLQVLKIKIISYFQHFPLEICHKPKCHIFYKLIYYSFCNHLLHAICSVLWNKLITKPWNKLIPMFSQKNKIKFLCSVHFKARFGKETWGMVNLELCKTSEDFKAYIQHFQMGRSNAWFLRYLTDIIQVVRDHTAHCKSNAQ